MNPEQHEKFVGAFARFLIRRPPTYNDVFQLCNDLTDLNRAFGNSIETQLSELIEANAAAMDSLLGVNDGKTTEPLTESDKRAVSEWIQEITNAINDDTNLSVQKPKK